MMKVKSKISLAVVFLIFSIFFLVGLITFKNYGIWTDEEFQRSSGFYWLNYVLSFTPFENLKTSANEISAQIGGFTLPSLKGQESYGIIFDLPAIKECAEEDPIVLPSPKMAEKSELS